LGNITFCLFLSQDYLYLLFFFQVEFCGSETTSGKEELGVIPRVNKN
jgi:hypothetical protein